jgi:peptidyl-prolyl cis-trans isomerase D
MAVLGKIREKSIFLILVIGMALFAFIISGVFTDPGMTSQKPIGVVNGEDISIEEFRNQVDFLERNYNLSGMAPVNNVWDQMIRTKILNSQYKLSGIDSGKDHIEFILSQNPSFSSDPRFLNDDGIFEIEKFIELITEIKTTNTQSYEQWKNQEKIFQTQSNEQIYFNLIKSGINFTQKDGENEYLLQNDNVDIEYIQIPFSSIADSLVSYKRSEIKQYIDLNENDFKVEASRDIQYVMFEEKPSLEDENAIKDKLKSYLVEKNEYNNVSKLEEIIPSLLTTKNISEFVNRNSEIKFDSIYLPKGSLASDHANILFDLDENQTYGPYLDGEYFKISRMLDKKKNGTARASHILVSFEGAKNASTQVTRSKAEAKKEANRILRLAKVNPDTFYELAFEFSDGPSKSSGGDLGFFQEGGMVKPFNDFVFAERIGSIGLVETDFGFHVIKVVAKEDVVLLASIAQKNIPSDDTSDRVFNLATKFEINLSKKLNLNDLAAENDYIVKPVNGIKVLDDVLPGLLSQRRVVQWLFSKEIKLNDYKRFDLSNGGYIIVQVMDITNDGLSSVANASFRALPKVLNSKKANLIIKQNDNKLSLKDLALNNNLEIKKALALNQKNATISGSGREPLLVGHAFGLDIDQISDFIIGENGVYKIKVLKKNIVSNNENYKSNKSNFIISYQNQLLNASRPNLNNLIYQAVKKKAGIEDNRSLYY